MSINSQLEEQLCALANEFRAFIETLEEFLNCRCQRINLEAHDSYELGMHDMAKHTLYLLDDIKKGLLKKQETGELREVIKTNEEIEHD
jgi:hypothetical protein